MVLYQIKLGERPLFVDRKSVEVKYLALRSLATKNSGLLMMRQACLHNMARLK